MNEIERSDGARLRRPAPFAEWEWALTAGSFEEVFATLEAVVGHLEDGQLPLAESIACYELGMRLAERCEQFLSEAELRVSRLEESVARFYDATAAAADDDDD
jgi:exodeoxyribonuclease VII small subunit